MSKLTAHYHASIATILWLIFYLTAQDQESIAPIVVGIFLGTSYVQLLFVTVDKRSVHSVIVAIAPIIMFIGILMYG